MNKQNNAEYAYVRSEIRDVKGCITTYMGYLLGGSGFACFGLVSLSKNGDAPLQYLSYASFSMALIISMVVLLILYKFTSHNRYAGYSKLLNLERYTPLEGHGDMSFISWELCWDRIRQSDFLDREYLLNKLEKVDIKSKDKTIYKAALEPYISKKSTSDKHKYLFGVMLLLKYCLGRLHSKSWVFPAYIVVCCFILCSLFMVGGVVFGIQYYFLEGVGWLNEWERAWDIVVFGLSFVLIQLLIWLSFCGKLYTLMEGSGTIEGYCIRFVPARAEYLNAFDLIPDYELLFDPDINPIKA